MGRSRASTKNAKRREKKKAAKAAAAAATAVPTLAATSALTDGDAVLVATAKHSGGGGGVAAPMAPVADSADNGIVVEYVSADVPDMPEFEEVFKRFARPEELVDQEGGSDGGPAGDEDEDEAGETKGETKAASEEKEGSDAELEEDEVLSRRQRRKRDRLTVSELKQLVRRPDVVEVHDVTASDPRLLVFLKSYNHTVPVPRHWCHKRKYLQGKRGIEKPPFELPDFIANTGIGKIRSAVQELDDSKRLKQQQREKNAPKMGKIDIDYQVLHDAFFRFQSKPKLTGHGDLYYESREFETQMKTRQPGNLSQELKEALGMPEGTPPPWLINMQASATESATPVATTHWGELQDDDDEEESDEEDDEEEEDGSEDPSGVDRSGMETPMDEGMTSVTTGLETPDTIDLRKGSKHGIETPDPSQVPQQQELYQVLQQQETHVDGGLYGASHKYVMPGAAAGAGGGAEGAEVASGSSSSSSSSGTEAPTGSGVVVEVNPAELDKLQDPAYLEQRRDEVLETQHGDKEDLSEVIAAEQRKRKRKQSGGAGSKKKKKETFKF